MIYDFDYRKLGDFTYHVLHDPVVIKEFLMQWIMREWVIDHNLAPDEHWTSEWMDLLPRMEFTLEILQLENIKLNRHLMSGEDFRKSLEERTDEREESILRGISIEPLLVNRDRFELMDGYTRYTVLKRYQQKDVFTYIGSV